MSTHSIDRLSEFAPLFEEEGVVGSSQTKAAGKTHAYFIQEAKVEYENSRTTTSVERREITEPTTSPEYIYPSREAMIKAAIASRPSTPIQPKEKHACYSDIPRANFDASITLKEPLLGLETGTSLTFENKYYHHSEFNGRAYMDDDGHVHTVHDAVASSWDRSTNDLMMARVLLDENGSIFYGGRPDTVERAKQQAEDIFRTELQLKEKGKGIKKLDDHTYELTYVVNSLTNGGELQNPGLLNERESLLAEMKALQSINGKSIEIEIDGEMVTVWLHPIHTHHMVSFWTRFADLFSGEISGLKIEGEINDIGYKKIKEIAQLHPENRGLILGAIAQLDEDLPVQERLMLIDLLAHLCNLPIAHHCKSIVDRTSIGGGVSTINHYIAHGKIRLDQIPKDDQENYLPHLLCRNEEYKHLFVATLAIQHQVSKDARMGIRPDGTIEGREQLGLNYHYDTFGTVPAALALMPEELLTTTWWDNKVLRSVTLVSLALFSPLILAIYYIGLLIFVIPFCTYKTGKWQGEFYKNLAIVPGYLIWHWQKIWHIDASKIFDFNSQEINGDERALLIGAKTTHMEADVDPRYAIMPEHLHPTKKV